MIRFARTAGRLCLAGSGLGVLQGLVLLVTPPAVGPDRYSYPLSPAAHVVAQGTFAIQHLLLLAGLVALARLQPAAARASRIGLWLGVIGLGLLTVMEIVTMTAADVATDSAYASMINSLDGIPTLIMGGGLVLGGIGFARSGRLTGDVSPRGCAAGCR